MAKLIAVNAHDQTSRWGMFTDRLMIPIAAASVFIAGYLLGEGQPLRLIWSCVDDRVEFDTIRDAYLALFEVRFDIISAQVLATAGLDAAGIDRILPSARNSELY